MSTSLSVTGASMARGRSKQDYETPDDFIQAVERRFGPLALDLAATSENAKSPRFITPEEDSLGSDLGSWVGDFRCFGGKGGNRWLNPPFANIAPWAAKCALSAPALTPHSRILLLVPASVGANWFAEHVHGHALVLALQGRLTFKGCDQPYPKDCVLAVYGVGLRGFDIWNWRIEGERR